ncbi:MAG: DegT/DnrJ/EryC1/StrS family aminotransferase [Acidimicrobiia bacterium]
MRNSYLHFAPPSIGHAERAEVEDTLRSGWITRGPKTEQFERDFAREVGAPHALAVSSCTAAMHLALLALGVGPGDEVVTTPMTFAATVNVIEHVGATPVLADIDPVTMQISPEAVARAVTPATRAILPVHYGGHPADMPAILEIARGSGRRIAVVEDAAHALPASIGEQKVGSIGDLTAFSFYATKNLTTGEGGMLTGGDDDLLSKARVLSLHGMSADAWRRYEPGNRWYYEVVAPGYKYNMTDVQAAIGLHQLRRLDGFYARRREIAARYGERFSAEPFFEVPGEMEGVRSAWHLYVLRLRPETLTIDRDRFVAELEKRNIGTSVHFIPVHLHPYYRDRYGYTPDSFPVASAAFERIVSLPLHPGLGDDDVEDVIEAVIDVAVSHHR